MNLPKFFDQVVRMNLSQFHEDLNLAVSMIAVPRAENTKIALPNIPFELFLIT